MTLESFLLGSKKEKVQDFVGSRKEKVQDSVGSRKEKSRTLWDPGMASFGLWDPGRGSPGLCGVQEGKVQRDRRGSQAHFRSPWENYRPGETCGPRASASFFLLFLDIGGHQAEF